MCNSHTHSRKSSKTIFINKFCNKHCRAQHELANFQTYRIFHSNVLSHIQSENFITQRKLSRYSGAMHAMSENSISSVDAAQRERKISWKILFVAYIIHSVHEIFTQYMPPSLSERRSRTCSKPSDDEHVILPSSLFFMCNCDGTEFNPVESTR